MSKIHTTGTQNTTFHHTDDFSGHVTIDEMGPKGERTYFVNIPFDDLEYIVTEKRRKALLSLIEDLDLSRSDDRAVVDALHIQMVQGI